MKKIIIPFLCLFLFESTHAEDEVFELSPFSVSLDVRLPPATIKRTGDNLVLKIHFVNDSRLFEQRETELYQTILDLVQKAKEESDIVLHSGEYELNKTNYKVKLFAATQRSDTTYTDLYAKIPLEGDSDVATLEDKLRSFAKTVDVVGRTEVFPNQVGISIVNPEKYRYEALQAIAADLKRVRDIFGEDYKVLINGLDQRVQWKRTSISEIEIYIAYSFQVSPFGEISW